MTIEEKAAKMLEFYEELSGTGDSSIETLREKIKSMQSTVDTYKGVDAEKILQEFDKLKAAQDSLRKSFVSSKKGGFYYAGMEDEAEKFELAPYIKGVITGDFKGAEAQKERVDEAMKAMRKDGAHIMGDDSLGGGFVPDQFIPDVILPAYRRSAFIALDGEGDTRISVMDRMTGGTVKIPKFIGGVAAYWIGEEDDYPESLAGTGNITATPKKLGVLIKLTESMLRFGSYGFEKLLRKDMAKAIASKIDYTMVFGRGSEDMPKGLAHQENVKYISASKHLAGATSLAMNKTEAKASGFFDGAAISVNLLGEIKLALQENDIPVTADFAHILPPRALLKLRARTNVAGEELIFDDAQLRALIGNFGESTMLQTNQNAGYGLFTKASSDNDGKCTLGVSGEMSELMLFRWGGIEFVSDNGLGQGFKNDTTLIKARMWCDIGNRSEESFVLTPDIMVR